MYIEFQLPNASAGQAAAHALLAIRRDLGYWSMQHNIRYTEKLHKLTLKVTLPTENDYTYFGLTWDPKFESSKKFRFIEPLDRPQQNI